MTSDTNSTFEDLRFELDLMHLLAGCEGTATSGGATAAADLASDLSQIGVSVQ